MIQLTNHGMYLVDGVPCLRRTFLIYCVLCTFRAVCSALLCR